MKSFTYVRPDSLDEALTLLEKHGPAAIVLAGGTDLAVRLRTGRILPEVVIDVKRIPALCAGVTETGAYLRVGAGTVMSDLITDARVRCHFPALAEAAHEVGSVQIRNRATLTGNVCNASPAADTAQPLLVYGAILNLVHSTGHRSVAINQFFKGPGRTDLRRGEIVESIDLPLPTERQGSAFARATRRLGVDLATVNLACRVKESGQTLLALGAVGPRPLLVTEDSGRLVDAACSETERAGILEELVSHATPISDVRASDGYRRGLLRVMSRRVFETAMGRLQEQEVSL
jgi:carbon-monoxide dehydrogenase medium subunit